MACIYRVIHKRCDFSDDLKLLKSSKFIGVSVFTFWPTIVDIYKKYWEQKYVQSVTCCNPQNLLKQDWTNSRHPLWVTLYIICFLEYIYDEIE